MRSAFAMWRNSRMIVLVSLCAGMYAAALLVFRTPPPVSVQILAMLLPMPMSLFFGPAAAWALPLGATVGDLVSGYIQIGSLFGLASNFLAGFLPYTLWTRLRPLASGTRELRYHSPRQWILFILVAVASSCACALVVAWPLDRLGLVPFRFLIMLIGVQNMVLFPLSAPLVILAFPRVQAMGLLWWETVDENELDHPGHWMGLVGAWLLTAAAPIAWGWAVLIPDAALVVGGIGALLVVLGAAMMW